MKLLLALALLVVSTSLYAQGEYERRLGTELSQLAAAQSPTDYADCATAFGELANHDGATWHANYYQAFALCVQSFRVEESAQRDALIDAAQVAWEAAKQREADASELVALQARIYQARISVDAENRSMSYGPKVMGILFSARAKDPTNPRLLFLLGQTVARTPAAYGGGPARALPLIEESLARFADFSSVDPFHPGWGQGEAEALFASLGGDTMKGKK
jgi:hypothetical protein